MEQWLPKSVLCLRNYTLQDFLADLAAGITVGLVALPLAMAFAIASGLSPQAGIYCAVVTGFLISALGGSRVQIGGPTGAFVVVVAGIVAKHGVDGLFMCTMMAGVLLFIMGATGLGAAVKFIPRPVVLGFTNGIAVLIASTQIKDFFGLTHRAMCREISSGACAPLPTTSTPSRGKPPCSACCPLPSFCSPRSWSSGFRDTSSRWCWARSPLCCSSCRSRPLARALAAFPPGRRICTSRSFTGTWCMGLISPAITVAMLGAIESLMSAVVADRMTGDKHNPNVELIGQGVANIVSPMFGGLPATGAIARTATNIRSGARTPVAGMIHSLTLLAILLFAAPLASHVPLVVLAGILMVVSYNMGEWAETGKILRLSKSDISVWLATFALDRLRRPDGRGRIRHDPGRAAVHPQGDGDHDGFRGHRRLRRSWPRTHPAGQGHSRLRARLPHSRAVSVRRDRQARYGQRATRRVCRRW